MFQKIKSRLHELVTGDTLFRKLLFQKLLSIHELVQRVDRSITKIEHDIITIKRTLTIPRPIWVVVFSPTAGMMSQAVHVSSGHEMTVRFQPQLPVPAGAFVTLIGEGIIAGVSVGNQAQLLSYCDAPMAITRDAADVGVYISVHVKGLQ